MAQLWEIALDRFTDKKKRGAGQPPKFDTPEQMAIRAREYFEWCSKTPLNEHKIFAQQGEIIDGEVKHKRPFTQAGLCVYLGISEDTWRNYRDKKPEYFEVTKLITDAMYDQKFSGASAGLFNANIIARDLGLKDKSEIDHQSTDGSMSPKDTSQTVLEILKKKYVE